MQYLIIGLLLINMIIVILLLLKSKGNNVQLEKILREEIRMSRIEGKTSEKELRQELLNAFSRQSSLIENNLDRFRTSLNDLIKENRQQTDKNRSMIETKLTGIQHDNNEKLEKMRETVEEKLQTTLQKRIGEAFTRVEQQLERVQKDLGKMQTLADGVGDLKRVLTNVKERGTWGEVKLGSILEQILTPEQFQANVQVKARSQERVDYAVKLPGNGTEEMLWLPIDAKFPQESYLRILQVSKTGDNAEVDKAIAELMKAIHKSAADIRDKYINPPHTTDFAIMFLPTEGLYSEVLRVAGELENIQQNYRVVIAGPTTLSAIMNSLRMGFKTLAIEKKASEVWKYLAVVKTQFRLFGDVMEKLKDQVSKVSRTIDKTSDRARIMDNKLRSLEQATPDEATDILKQDESNTIE